MPNASTAPPPTAQPAEGERWVHTLSHHPIGSVIGWPSEDSPTGWWSGIVREIGSTCVLVDDIRPGIIKR
jgi:hypothetical protein